MRRFIDRLIFTALLLLIFASAAYAPRYMYLSDCELTRFGERIKFWHGDTLEGPVHTNGEFAMMMDPQFYDYVTSGACQFWGVPPAIPGFHGPAPQFRVARVNIPATAQTLRDGAMAEGLFYSEPGKSYRVRFEGSTARVFRWFTGTLFDSTDCWALPLTGRRCIFFDRPLEIYGHLTGQVSIGSSHNVLLLDNIWYDDATLLPNGGYTLPPAASTNILQVVSEAEIKVANTTENGRNHSNGLGNNQSNRDLTDIVIMGELVALGESFTFEQQNDPDSGYVYQNPPGTPAIDDRGQIYLLGSLVQWRRGYVHRASNGSTGYLKRYKFDQRFRHMMAPCGFAFDDTTHYPPDTDTLDFAGVPVGATVWDTVHVNLDSSVTLGSVLTQSPFWATRVPPFYSHYFAIPVSFTPPHSGQFAAILQISFPGHTAQIPLRGRGLPGGSPPLRLEISPNPFNLTTTIRYTVPQAGAVRITLYDVLGRLAKQLDVASAGGGEHSVQLQATDLASGVYIIRLQAAGQTMTKKVLLLK